MRDLIEVKRTRRGKKRLINYQTDADFLVLLRSPKIGHFFSRLRAIIVGQPSLLASLTINTL
jgi:hypothetical protein